MKSVLGFCAAFWLLCQVQAEDRCIPLTQCRVLNWMLRNRNHIEGQSSHDVIGYVFSRHCGFENLSTPKVRCPADDDFEVGVEEASNDINDEEVGANHD